MDEVLVKRWCDLCRGADRKARTEATARYTISIGRDERPVLPRRVDCCDKHEAQIVGLTDLIRDVGEAIRDEVAGTAPEGDPRLCPVCGKVMYPKSVPNHLVNAHNAKAIKQPAKCPDCPTKVDTPQGMILHRRRNHDYDYRAELVASIPKGKGGQR